MWEEGEEGVNQQLVGKKKGDYGYSHDFVWALAAVRDNDNLVAFLGLVVVVVAVGMVVVVVVPDAAAVVALVA